MRSDAFDQQRELRMKEEREGGGGGGGVWGVRGGEGKDLGMRVVWRTAVIMIMKPAVVRTHVEEDDADEALGRGNDRPQ